MYNGVSKFAFNCHREFLIDRASQCWGKLAVLQCMSVYSKCDCECMHVIGSVCHHWMKGLRLAHCSLSYQLFASFSENVISCRQRCIEDLWQLQKKDKKSLICRGLEGKLKNRKNCECCPGHSLIVNLYSSMSILNRCLCSHCSHCSQCLIMSTCVY